MLDWTVVAHNFSFAITLPTFYDIDAFISCRFAGERKVDSLIVARRGSIEFCMIHEHFVVI
jgi:hypothetical protein